MLVIASDIETYGFAETDAHGRALPAQTVFHPARMQRTDGIARNRIVQTCSVTLIEATPHVGPLTVREIAGWRPGETAVFDFSNPAHVAACARLHRRATTILGHNWKYDLLALRTVPAFSFLGTSHRPLLIDTIALSFMWDEELESRNLKWLLRLLNLYRHTETLASVGRFPSSTCPAATHYAAEDTHGTTLLAACLARFIISEYPDSPKLTHPPLRLYSDLTYACARMEESGYAMSRFTFSSWERDTLARLDDLASALAAHDLPLAKGVTKVQRTFFTSLLDACDKEGDLSILGVPTIYATKLLEYPAKAARGAAPSVSVRNLQIVTLVLPSTHPLHKVATLWIEAKRLSKLISSYAQPLLRCRTTKGKKSPHSSTLLPPTPHGPGVSSMVALAYPSIFILPSRITDDASSTGGQIQGRISFQDPGLQTNPPPIKAHARSRYNGGSLLTFDLGQIEPRIAALCSGCPVLSSVFLERRDFHSLAAIELWGVAVTSDPHWKTGDPYLDKRQWSKMIGLADLYLSSAATMQGQALKQSGILLPLPILNRAVARRATAKPVLYGWQMEVIARCKRDLRYILPIYGQSRTFIDDTDASTMVNFPIQTQAANITSDIAVYLDNHLPPPNTGGIELVLNTHDALTLDAPSHLIPEARDLYAAAFAHTQTNGYYAALCDHYGRTIPLTFDTTEKPHDAR